MHLFHLILSILLHGVVRTQERLKITSDANVNISGGWYSKD